MSNEGNTRFTFPGKTKESKAIMVLLQLINKNCGINVLFKAYALRFICYRITKYW